MYPQPATQTAANRRPQWQLAGRKVTQSMFYDCQKAKQAGRKVFFITAGGNEMTGLADDDCANCNGFGHMALEVVMGGPFKNAPQGSTGTADKEPEVLLRPAWHHGAWWSVTRQMYPCPACQKEARS